MSQVTNLFEESCRQSFARQLSSVLSHEGEQPDVSAALASKTASTLLLYRNNLTYVATEILSDCICGE